MLLLGLVQLALLLGAGGILVLQSALDGEFHGLHRAQTAARELALELEGRIEYGTEFARQFVATSDPLYLRFYEIEVAIHEGKAPVPLDYSSHYWHRVMAGELALPPMGTSESFLKRADRVMLTAPERRLLDEAVQAWAAQRDYERMIMQRWLLRRDDEPPRAQPALHSALYLSMRNAAFRPIEDLRASIESRFSARFADIEGVRRRLSLGLLLMLVASGSSLASLFVFARAGLLRPLRLLGEWADRGADGPLPSGLTGLDRLGTEIGRIAAELRELREDREQMLRALQLADARFGRLAAQIEDMAFECRVDPVLLMPRFSYAGPRAQQVLGITAERFMAQPEWLEQAMSEPDRSALRTAVSRAIAAQGPMDITFDLNPQGAGSPRRIQLLACPVEGNRGRHAYSGLLRRIPWSP